MDEWIKLEWAIHHLAEDASALRGDIEKMYNAGVRREGPNKPLVDRIEKIRATLASAAAQLSPSMSKADLAEHNRAWLEEMRGTHRGVLP